MDRALVISPIDRTTKATAMQRITYKVMREHLGDAPKVRDVEILATPKSWIHSTARDTWFGRALSKAIGWNPCGPP